MNPRPTITVPDAGLSERNVREALGLERAQLHALMETGLGSPHDYSFPVNATAYCFTADGVRKLVALAGQDLEVRAEGTSDPAPTTTAIPLASPRHPQRAAAQDGYQPDLFTPDPEEHTP